LLESTFFHSNKKTPTLGLRWWNLLMPLIVQDSFINYFQHIANPAIQGSSSIAEYHNVQAVIDVSINIIAKANPAA
tara:strand:+ start:422 stop:649 length:228 start_codon:yes stop_codon:yes gene_type:complete